MLFLHFQKPKNRNLPETEKKYNKFHDSPSINFIIENDFITKK